MTNEGLGRRIARSAAWSVLLRLSVRGLGLISTLVLVRILVPADFGLVAMAALAIEILDFIFDFSFTQFLIRERSEERSLYNTVWSLAVLRGLLIAGLIAGGGPWVASFYGEPRLVPIFWVLAAATAIAGFENVGTVNFQKNLHFHREFRYRATIKLIGFCVTVTLALTLRSYWALVWGTLASQTTLMILSYVMSDYRPRFDLSQTRRVFAFSFWFMVASLFGAFHHRSPALVLGRTAGASSVGLFEVGREVASLPTTELVWPIARTLFPGYALAAGDRAMMRKLFLDSSAIMLCLGVPLALGIAATSELVVRIALGTNWLGAIPVIEIMAVCGVVRLSYSGCQSIIMALGKPNLYAQLAFWSFVVTLPPMVYGAVKYGLTGAAIGYLAGIVLSAAMSQLSALRLLELRLRDFARASKRSIAAGLLMYAAIAATLHWLPPSTASPLELGVLALMCVVAGAAVYIAGLLGLWRLEGKPAGGEQILYDEFRRRIGRA